MNILIENRVKLAALAMVLVVGCALGVVIADSAEACSTCSATCRPTNWRWSSSWCWGGIDR
jgi:hypothetical protein